MSIQDRVDQVILIATPQPWMTLAEARHRCTNYDEVLDSRHRKGYDLVYILVKEKANRLVRNALANPQQCDWVEVC